MPAISNRKGFSLFLLILFVAGIAVLGVAAVTFTTKVKTVEDEKQTVVDLTAIQQAAAKYYRSHENLPGAPGAAGLVPVGAAELNLDGRYRQDSWGQTVEYYRAADPGAGNTFINNVTVNGRDVAGYVLSFGPNQKKESTLSGGSIDTAGDDILLPLNVQAEAVDITVEELETLTRRQCAWRKSSGSWYDWNTAPDTFLANFGLSGAFKEDPWARQYTWVEDNPDSGHFEAANAPNTGTIAGPTITSAYCTFGGGTPPVPEPLGQWLVNEGPSSGSGQSVINNYGESGTGSNGQINQGQTGWIPESPSGQGWSLLLGAQGGNSNITVSGWTPFNFSYGSRFTLSAWIRIYPAPASGDMYVIRKKRTTGSAAGRRGYAFKILSGTHNLRFELADDTGASIGVNGTTDLHEDSVTRGHWHHVVATYDGWQSPPVMDVYVDGVKETSAANASTLTGSINNTRNLEIGDNLNGFIADVAIWDLALNADQVVEVYHWATARRYLFEGNTYDRSPNTIPATLNSTNPPDPSYAADRYGTGGRALTLDGADDYADMGGDTGPGASLNFRANTSVTVGQGGNATTYEAASGGFSVMVWFKTTEDYGPLVSFRHSNNNVPSGLDPGAPDIDLTIGYDGGVRSGGSLMGLVRDDQNEGSYARITGPAVNDGQWHQAVLSRANSGNIALYLDGQFQGTASSSWSDLGITTDLRNIGREARWVIDNFHPEYEPPTTTDSSRFLGGQIDDVVIFPRDISPKEVKDEWCRFKTATAVAYGAACP